MSRTFTIKDVAKAGVSIGTVDRVLHNRGASDKNRNRSRPP